MKGKITAIYAWLATEPDGTEGVIGHRTPQGWMPLVGADADRMNSLKSIAEVARKTTGVRVQLVRFITREDLEELP